MFPRGKADFAIVCRGEDLQTVFFSGGINKNFLSREVDKIFFAGMSGKMFLSVGGWQEIFRGASEPSLLLSLCLPFLLLRYCLSFLFFVCRYVSLPFAHSNPFSLSRLSLQVLILFWSM